MVETLREALRERLAFWAALQWVGFLAFLWYVLDPSLAQFATTLVSLAVFGLTELVTDVYDVRQSVRNGSLGIYAVVGGAAMALFDDGGGLWLPVAFVLVGVWFVADAVQTVRHEGATEEEPTGRDVYHDYVARRVHETVEERAHTRRELYEALEADDDAVDAAVERLESRGVVVCEGSLVQEVEPEDDGIADRVRNRIGGSARRVARPLTLELERDESGAIGARGDARTAAQDLDRRTKPDETPSAESDGGAEAGTREREEREREREPTD